jgi:hypothetical protein
MVHVRAEVKGRQPRVTRGRVERPSGGSIPRAACSIAEFCEAFGISIRTYFKLREGGKGPREMRLGRRVLIAVESALAWAREREAASARLHRQP